MPVSNRCTIDKNRGKLYRSGHNNNTSSSSSSSTNTNTNDHIGLLNHPLPLHLPTLLKEQLAERNPLYLDYQRKLQILIELIAEQHNDNLNLETIQNQCKELAECARVCQRDIVDSINRENEEVHKEWEQFCERLQEMRDAAAARDEQPQDDDDDDDDDGRRRRPNSLREAIVQAFTQVDEVDVDEMQRLLLQDEVVRSSQIVDQVLEHYEEEGRQQNKQQAATVTFVPLTYYPQQEDVVVFNSRRLILCLLIIMCGFACDIFQVFPSFLPAQSRFQVENYLYELARLKDFTYYAMHCQMGFENKWRDCSNGVVHVPEHQLLNSDSSSTSGISGTWWLDCLGPQIESTTCSARTHSYPERLAYQFDVSNSSNKGGEKCFRGITDGLLTKKEIDSLLKFAGDLVEKSGGDHIMFHYDIRRFKRRATSVYRKLAALLKKQFIVTAKVKPVAYRFHASVPASFDRSDYEDISSRHVKRVINMNAIQPYRMYTSNITQQTATPFRDPCILMYDKAVDERFHFHTSIFLTDYRADYTGGQTLYTNSNDSSSFVIQNGLVVEGSVGRIVSHSGGQENLRCRLPVKSGVRIVLQVWWDCA